MHLVADERVCGHWRHAWRHRAGPTISLLKSSSHRVPCRAAMVVKTLHCQPLGDRSAKRSWRLSTALCPADWLPKQLQRGPAVSSVPPNPIAQKGSRPVTGSASRSLHFTAVSSPLLSAIGRSAHPHSHFWCSTVFGQPCMSPQSHGRSSSSSFLTSFQDDFASAGTPSGRRSTVSTLKSPGNSRNTDRTAQGGTRLQDGVGNPRGSGHGPCSWYAGAHRSPVSRRRRTQCSVSDHVLTLSRHDPILRRSRTPSGRHRRRDGFEGRQQRQGAHHSGMSNGADKKSFSAAYNVCSQFADLPLPDPATVR
jgi:hypothetical protein